MIIEIEIYFFLQIPEFYISNCNTDVRIMKQKFKKLFSMNFQVLKATTMTSVMYLQELRTHNTQVVDNTPHQHYNCTFINNSTLTSYKLETILHDLTFLSMSPTTYLHTSCSSRLFLFSFSLGLLVFRFVMVVSYFVVFSPTVSCPIVHAWV